MLPKDLMVGTKSDQMLRGMHRVNCEGLEYLDGINHIVFSEYDVHTSHQLYHFPVRNAG